jgi:hypothetical protein
MGMDGNNQRYASAFTVRVSIRPTAPQWTSGRGYREAALRMQLATFQRKRKRPLLTTLDRVFWITLQHVEVQNGGAGVVAIHRRLDLLAPGDGDVRSIAW